MCVCVCVRAASWETRAAAAQEAVAKKAAAEQAKAEKAAAAEQACRAWLS